MNIREQQYIKVLNYGPSQVCVDSKNRGYLFPGASEDGPSVEYMSFQDIEYINSRCPVFTNGLLRFDAEVEDEVFSELKNFNWRERMWTEEDIEDVVLSPTPENQKRIIDVKDISTIERIRGRAVRLVNQDSDIISNKIVTLIDARFKELSQGRVNSQLEVSGAKPAAPVVERSAEIDEVVKKNEELEAKLANMSKMMEQILAAQSAGTPAAQSTTAKASTPATKQASTAKQPAKSTKKPQAK